MRPDQRWFPTGRVERAAWFGNFAAQFEKIGLSLGFTQAEIDQVSADNAVVQFAARVVFQMEAYISALKSYQRTVTLGDIGTAAAAFPALPSLNVPAAVPNGIFERLERLVRRIRVQPAYTPAAGALLNIIPRKENLANLDETKPTVQILSGTSPYSFAVKTPRRNFSAFQVEIARGSSQVWEPAGIFVHSPAVIHIEPTSFGQPELLQVRVRMMKGNQPVGQYSDIKIVTVAP